jgi:hypothetical protein
VMTIRGRSSVAEIESVVSEPMPELEAA